MTRPFRSHYSPRERLWMRTAPPVKRRGKLWRLRGRIHHRHGYRSHWGSVRQSMPNLRAARLVRAIHTAESREADREAYE